MFKDEKTRYPGIYRRTHSSGAIVYVARVRARGAGEASESFDRLTDAYEWFLKQASALREKGVLGSFGRSKATVGEAMDRYIAEELPRLALSEQPNRLRHLAWWREQCAEGAMRLRHLTRAFVRERIHQLRGEGQRKRPVTYATGNRYQAALSALLSACEDWEWIPENPLHKSGRRKKAKGDREVARERDWIPKEMERLRAACETSREKRLFPLLILALASGAREGELLRLEWGNLELDPQDYDPLSGQNRPGVPRCEIDGKNGDNRVLYFPGEAAEVLRQRSLHAATSRYVFEDADHPGEVPTFPADAWRYAKKKSKVKDLRFHDLRHFWACHLLESGASIPQLMILGGWRSIASMRIYIARAERRGSTAVHALHVRSRVAPPLPWALPAPAPPPAAAMPREEPGPGGEDGTAFLSLDPSSPWFQVPSSRHESGSDRAKTP